MKRVQRRYSSNYFDLLKDILITFFAVKIPSFYIILKYYNVGIVSYFLNQTESPPFSKQEKLLEDRLFLVGLVVESIITLYLW